MAAGVAPGHAWPRRVWQALAVLARGPEGPREVVRTRCERGADIARMLRFTDDTVQAIRTFDEHWDGNGQPYGLKGDATLLLGRVVGLAQTLEVYVSTFGVRTAYETFTRHAWLDPLRTRQDFNAILAKAELRHQEARAAFVNAG